MDGSVDLEWVGRWFVSGAIGLSVLMLGAAIGQERTSNAASTPRSRLYRQRTHRDLSQDGTLESPGSLPLRVVWLNTRHCPGVVYLSANEHGEKTRS